MKQNADHYKFVIKDVVKQSSPMALKQPELILFCLFSPQSLYVPHKGGETILFVS